MSTIKNTLPTGCEELVYNSANIKIEETPETVPTTIGNDKWKKLLELKNDTNPYIKIEAIPIPCEGSGGIYEESFFESFNKRIETAPIAGDKYGHEWTSRQPSDCYTIGSKIAKNSKGETFEYLKIYIPPMGFVESNSGLICDAEMGIAHFSLVTRPKYNVTQDEDGNSIRHFTESMGRERNDVVGYKEGAMDQEVNSKHTEFDYNLAKNLVENKQYKTKGDSDGSIIQNGFVMRPVLRKLLSHADCENKEELSSLVSMIDKQKNTNGGVKVELNEAYEMLKNSLTNGKIDYKNAAEQIGISDKLRNEADEKNADTVKELNSLFAGSKDLITDVKAMNKANKDNAELAVKNAVIHEFGNEKIKNGKNEDVDNKAYIRAMELCANKSGDELTTALENAKGDIFIKDILSNRADNNSEFNTVIDDKSEKNSNSFSIGSGAVTL